MKLVKPTRWTIVAFVATQLTCLGCGKKEPMYKSNGQLQKKVTFHLAQVDSFPGSEEFVLPKDKPFVGEKPWQIRDRIFIGKEAAISNGDIEGTSVFADKVFPEIWYIEIYFTPSGREKLADLTRNKLGSYCAVFFDGQYDTVMDIKEEITTGKMVIQGSYSEDRAKQFAKALVGQ